MGEALSGIMCSSICYFEVRGTYLVVISKSIG
jgi:hypothetical protein